MPRQNSPEPPQEPPEDPPEQALSPALPDPATPFDHRTNPKPFPIPPRPSMKGGYCKEEVGMAYWLSIPDEFQDRLTVYINREHPVLNRLQECSEADLEMMRTHKKRYPIKYIDLPAEKFSEDTRGEFLNRYGSGKYKVFINDVGIKGRKEADLQSRNLCKFFVSVYDSDYPAILDPSRPDKGLGILDWTHPDNQSYVADLRTRGIFPPNEKAGDDVAESSVVSKLVDKMSDLSDRVGVHETDRLVERIVERVGGGNGAGSRASEMVDTIKAVKELLPNPAPAAAADAPGKDPLAIAVALFQTMNQMKAENPVIDMYRDELRAMREELKEERAASRAAKEASTVAAAPRSLVDQLKELAGLGDSLGPIIKLFTGNTAAAVAEATRPAKTTFFDFVSDFASTPAGTQVAHGLASMMANLSARPAIQQNPGQIQNAPIVLNQQNPDGTAPQESADQRLERIGRTISHPMIFQYLYPGESGEVFAQWMFDGMPEDFIFLKQLGPEMIVSKYRQVPQAWALISHKESEFIEFVKEFCSWDPAADDNQAPAEGGVTSLEEDEENPDA